MWYIKIFCGCNPDYREVRERRVRTKVLLFLPILRTDTHLSNRLRLPSRHPELPEYPSPRSTPDPTDGVRGGRTNLDFRPLPRTDSLLCKNPLIRQTK